jgi:hypothetical protein
MSLRNLSIRVAEAFVLAARGSRAGLDLAFEPVRVQYAGSWAAEEGRRIALD